MMKHILLRYLLGIFEIRTIKSTVLWKLLFHFFKRHVIFLLFTFFVILFYTSQVVNITSNSNEKQSRKQLKDAKPRNQEFGTQNYNHMPKSLTNYISWHHKMRRHIESGTHFPTTKILVWKSRKCSKVYHEGLGEKLLGIQFSFLLALLTNKVIFIHWQEEPFPILSVIKPNLINWTLPENIKNYSDWASMSYEYGCNIVWNGASKEPMEGYDCFLNEFCTQHKQDTSITSNELLSVLKKCQNITTNSTTSYESIDCLLRNKHIPQSFVDLKNFKHHGPILQRHLLRLLFQPHSRVSEMLTKINKRKTRRYMSVYIQTSLNRNLQSRSEYSKLNHSNSTRSLLHCALKLAQRRKKDVFFATDSTELIEMALEISKKLMGSIMYTKLPAEHIGYRRNFFTSYLTIHDLEKFVVVFIDFFRISNGEIVLTNGSVFSRAAFLFGNGSRLIDVGINQGSRCNYKRKTDIP